MHEITADKVRDMLDYYRSAKTIAYRTEIELMRIISGAENFNKPIDGIKVLGLVRQAAADLRGLKAP